MNARPKTYVYIAGPYGDKDGYVLIDERINRARYAAMNLAERGIPFYAPHLNCAHFEVIAPTAPVEFWTAMGLGFVQFAWGLLILNGWENSKGTRAEIAEARRLGIGIYLPGESVYEEIALDWEYGVSGGNEDRDEYTDAADATRGGV